MGERHSHNYNTGRLFIVESTPLYVSLSVEFLLAGKRKVKNFINFRKACAVCIEIVCILLVWGSKALNVEFSYRSIWQ